MQVRDRARDEQSGTRGGDVGEYIDQLGVAPRPALVPELHGFLCQRDGADHAEHSRDAPPAQGAPAGSVRHEACQPGEDEGMRGNMRRFKLEDGVERPRIVARKRCYPAEWKDRRGDPQREN